MTSDAREVGIPFAGAMAKRTRTDEKLVTRRVIDSPGAIVRCESSEGYWHQARACDLDDDGHWGNLIRCKYNAPALWVREALLRDGDGFVRYAADDAPVRAWACPIPGCGCMAEATAARWPWKPRALGAMYCPRWACRTLLDVVSVRAERLGDMTDAEAVLEGFGWDEMMPPAFSEQEAMGAWTAAEEMIEEKVTSRRAREAAYELLLRAESPLAAFRVAWEALGHEWDDAQWVWRVEFRRRTT